MNFMDYSSRCTEWADRNSKNLSLSDQAQLDQHVAKCVSCQEMRKRHQFVAKSLQVLPTMKALPDITFQQLLAQERADTRRRHDFIQTLVILLASLVILALLFVLFSYPNLAYSGILQVILGSILTSLLISTIFPAAIHLGEQEHQKRLCSLTRVIGRLYEKIVSISSKSAFFLGVWRLIDVTQEILLNAAHKVSEICVAKVLAIWKKPSLVRLIGQFLVIGVMVLALVSPFVISSLTGGDIKFLTPLTIGLIPYYIRRRRLGEGYMLEVQAIFWQVSVKHIPLRNPRWEWQVPLIMRIQDIIKSAKNLRWRVYL